MKENDFKIVFDTETHEVEVETLIGCLMHTSNIVQEVNKNLDTNKKIEIKIKALEKGSFEVHIELVESIIANLFSNESISIAANIITVVGGLYSFAYFLKGHKPQKVEKQDGDKVKITNNNGEVTIIKGNVYNIYSENEQVRNSISKQFSVLEKNKDITGFKFQSNEVETCISDEDFQLVATKLDSLDQTAKDPIKEELTDKKLLIVRASFVKDLKWDFVYEGNKISAKMDNAEMIRIIDEGEQFAKGDYMLVDLEITKFYDADLGVHLITKDSYKILRYKQHIKSPKQGKLF